MPFLGQIEEAPGPPNRPERVPNWWDGILKQFETYDCYATFLMLPSDDSAARYLLEFREELQQITGTICLFLVFKGPDLVLNFRDPAADRAVMESAFSDWVLAGIKERGGDYRAELAKRDRWDWSSVVRSLVTKGSALALAATFKVPYENMPCLLLFRDVRKPHHVLVSFRGMDTEEIAETMRQTFTRVRDSVLARRDPLKELAPRRLHVFGRRLRKVSGSTFELVISALVRATMKPDP